MHHDIPLSSRSMDIMMTKLDRNQDGFVDYEELAHALKEYTRRLTKRQKRFGRKSLPVIDQLETLRQKIRLRLENSGAHSVHHDREWHI